MKLKQIEDANLITSVAAVAPFETKDVWRELDYLRVWACVDEKY